MLWDYIKDIFNSFYSEGEFVKFTLVSKYDTSFSVMFPFFKTDLLWHIRRDDKTEKIPCTGAAPEYEITFLHKSRARKIDPSQHKRIKKFYKTPPGEYLAFLMPNANLATEIIEDSPWFFFNKYESSIAQSKQIIIEAYDIADKRLPHYYIYNSVIDEIIEKS